MTSECAATLTYHQLEVTVFRLLSLQSVCDSRHIHRVSNKEMREVSTDMPLHHLTVF